MDRLLARPRDAGQLEPPHCPSNLGAAGAWLGMFICWLAFDRPRIPSFPNGVGGIIMASLIGITPCKERKTELEFLSLSVSEPKFTT